MTTSRKNRAMDFLTLASQGQVEEAFSRYVGPAFVHHNAYFPASAEALKAAMRESALRSPEKRVQIQRALEDGPWVAVHSHVRPTPEALGVAVVHLFRFEGERIAEMWDVGQPVPESCPNADGMF